MGKPSYISNTDYQEINAAICNLCKTDTWKNGENSYTMSTISYSSDSDGKNRAMRILGLAIHSATDTYAHKAIVPNTDAVRKKIKACDINTKSGVTIKSILGEIAEGKLTTAALGGSYENANKANQEYPDNPNFESERFKYGAQNAAKRLMKDYYYKADFNFKTFYHEKNTIKQYRILTYVTKANGGTAPAGVDWVAMTACD